MRLSQEMAFKAIATFLVFAIVQVSVQLGFAEANPANAAPQKLIARLAVRGNDSININGNRATTGASIVTGTLIETAADQGATIHIGQFTTLEVGANTRLRIDFDDNGNTTVRLIAGCVILRTRQKSEGEILMDTGTSGKTDKNKGGMLDVCFLNGQSVVNQGAAQAAGVGAGSSIPAAAAGAGGGLSSGAIAAIALLGVGGAVGLIFALQGSNGSPTSGSTP